MYICLGSAYCLLGQESSGVGPYLVTKHGKEFILVVSCSQSKICVLEIAWGVSLWCIYLRVCVCACALICMCLILWFGYINRHVSMNVCTYMSIYVIYLCIDLLFTIYVKQIIIWLRKILKEMTMENLVFHALSVMWILKSQCSATTWRKNTALTLKMQYVFFFTRYFVVCDLNEISVIKIIFLSQ